MNFRDSPVLRRQHGRASRQVRPVRPSECAAVGKDPGAGAVSQVAGRPVYALSGLRHGAQRPEARRGRPALRRGQLPELEAKR